MRRLVFLVIVLCYSCKNRPVGQLKDNPAFTSVDIELLSVDSMSIRAIEVEGEDLYFAGSGGQYGHYDSQTEKVSIDSLDYQGTYPEFRATAKIPEAFLFLSVANPALLYRQEKNKKPELVYVEEHEKVFYDAMEFWNSREGIAMGDPVGNCLSVIITRDAGKSWKKLSCDNFPPAYEGEAAFAASDANIAISGEKTWIISGGMKSRVFFSPDRGKTWEVFDLPVIQGAPTKGAYAIDFYDGKKGFVIGGDYLLPEEKTDNKAYTVDGGKTWNLISSGSGPGYKSGIRYVPGSEAEELVAIGFTGISYSADAGETWKSLSEEGFYTLRFINDSTAYAAGKNKLARLKFR